MQVQWLPRNTLKLHPPGSERRWLLRPITIRRPSWQTGRRVRWFGNGTSNSADALAIRIPLVNPADGRATIGGYSCPCNPLPEGDSASPGMCPACAESVEKAGGNPCKDGPCCTDPKCADAGLRCVWCGWHVAFAGSACARHVRSQQNVRVGRLRLAADPRRRWVDCTQCRLLNAHSH
jgi:hypothetical protein